MNFCYWYAIIWSAILFFYSLDWSGLNTDLLPEVKWFLIISIFIAFILGYLNRSLFKFRKPTKFRYANVWITLAVVLGFVITLLYMGVIPIFTVFQGSGYVIRRTIPVFYVVLITYSSFYYVYLLYIFICTNRKIFLFQALAIILFYMLLFLRGHLVMLLFMSLVMVLGANKERIKSQIRVKHIFLLFIGAILTLWLFGVMGNIRQGYSWNDCSLIEAAGDYVDRYPNWLPKEFMWAYSYITSPLNNMNNSMINMRVELNAFNYCVSYLPDFLTKRITPNYDASSSIVLVNKAFNATAGFIHGYVYGGFFGMLNVFLIIIVGPLVILRSFKPLAEMIVPSLVITCLIVVFMFFVNTLSYSGISFQLVYPMSTFLIKRGYNPRRVSISFSDC